MKTFRVYTDEKITLWQRVGLVIEAENEDELRKMLDSGALDVSKGVEYSGDVDPYWGTEEHSEWDHGSPTITEIRGDE